MRHALVGIWYFLHTIKQILIQLKTSMHEHIRPPHAAK